MTAPTHCSPLTRLPEHLKSTWRDIASVRPYTHPDKDADWVAKGLAFFLRPITTAQRLVLSYKSGIPLISSPAPTAKAAARGAAQNAPRFESTQSQNQQEQAAVVINLNVKTLDLEGKPL